MLKYFSLILYDNYFRKMTWNTNNEDLMEENNLNQEQTQEEISWNDENISSWNDEISLLKEALARNQADFLNYKKRVERDREDTIFFIKSDVFKKILPRIDDLERILKNTPEDQKNTPIYEWVSILKNNFLKNLESLWVIPFTSVWEEVNPEKHEVMTQIPSDKPWIIVDEFETWYMLWDRVLRVSKVVVWA